VQTSEGLLVGTGQVMQVREHFSLLL
jgi:hypothetical protein